MRYAIQRSTDGAYLTMEGCWSDDPIDAALWRTWSAAVDCWRAGIFVNAWVVPWEVI